jgi:hypothetical protein
MKENIDINDILREEHKIKDIDFKLFCEAFNRSPYNLMELIKFKECKKLR